MSDRRRLVVENGERLPEVLLHHARTDGPTDLARARALSRIVAASAASGMGVLAASLTNKGATASFAKTSAVAIAKWVAIGAATATTILGAREVAERLSPTSSADRGSAVVGLAQAPAAREDRARATTPFTTPSPVEPSAIAEDPATNEPKAPIVSNGHRSASQPSEVPGARRATPPELPEMGKPVPELAVTAARQVDVASPQLSRELELLEKARVHLARKSPWAALDALASYQAAFPGGTMTTEAAALQVEALAAAGRRVEAVTQGRAFLAAHAQNPLAERVRGIVAKIESPAAGR